MEFISYLIHCFLALLGGNNSGYDWLMGLAMLLVVCCVCFFAVFTPLRLYAKLINWQFGVIAVIADVVFVVVFCFFSVIIEG